MKQPTDWDEKMCGNLQHMFNSLRMFEELDSGNELEEPESQNVHLKKKKKGNNSVGVCVHSSCHIVLGPTGRYLEVPVNYQGDKDPLAHLTGIEPPKSS